MSYKLTVDVYSDDTTKEFGRLFKASLSKVLKPQMIKVVESFKKTVQSEVKRKLGKKKWHSKGTLAKSWRTKVRGRNVTVEGTVYSKAPHAEVQDKGERLKPKKAQWLAQPLSKEADRRGSPRKWRRGELFLLKKGGKLILVKRWKNGKLRAHYLLRKETKVPKSNYLASAFKRHEARLKRDWWLVQTKALKETREAVRAKQIKRKVNL